MRVSRLRHSRIISAALAALTASSAVCANAGEACAAGSTFSRHSMAIGAGPRLMSRSVFNPMALGKPLIFDSDENQNVIDIYLQAKPNTMVGQIVGYTNNPTILATDVSGNLYVVNEGYPNIPVFAPPYTKGPTRIQQTNGYLPQALGVSSKGIVAVDSFAPQNNTEIVSFYAAGATTPCNAVHIPDHYGPYNISFDRAGDAFFGGLILPNNLPFVAEIKGGCAAKKAELLTVENNLLSVADLHVNKNNDVALLDYDAGDIYTYKLPVNGSLGNPVSTTATPNAFNFTLIASGLDLFASIGTLQSNTVTEFTYPGGKVDESFNQPSIGYVAAWPPLIP